jgi:hypothetical protein
LPDRRSILWLLAQYTSVASQFLQWRGLRS